MIRTYEAGNSRYKPTMRLLCIILSALLLVLEIILSIFEYVSFRLDDNPLSAVFAGVFTIHSFVTLFYLIGVFRLVECFMVPWLTLQLIFLTSFSLFIVVWWIATVLAIFGLIEYHTTFNDHGLTNSEFFVLTGCILTFVLFVSIKVSQILYRGFVSVRNQNISCYRITETIEPQFEKKPTVPLKPNVPPKPIVPPKPDVPLKPSYV